MRSFRRRAGRSPRPRRAAGPIAAVLSMVLVSFASLASATPEVTSTAAPARRRVLFLRAAFPDQPATRPWSDFQNPSRSGLIDRMVDYYDEVSSRRFHIDAIVGKQVYTLPRRRAEYVGKTAMLVQDAVRLATAPPPAGEGDLIAGARPQAVVVLFAGPGAESDIKKVSTQNPWSEAIAGLPLELGPGVVASRAMVVAEDPYPPLSPFGVLCHEFGHVLGLPELYAPNQVHEGIGTWGLMGQGTWVGLGDAPPHLDAWSKLRLGWVDATLVDATQRVTLPAVEKSAQVVKIWAKGPEVPSEYFLIENRRRIGADRRVPGEGLLIWHVDESRDSFRRSQDDAKRKRLDLLTADSWPSHLDVGHSRGGNRGDAGDPWSGRRDGPGPDTLPSTAAYDGTPGRFRIANISPPGELMTFDVVFEGDAAPAPPAASTTGAAPTPRP